MLIYAGFVQGREETGQACRDVKHVVRVEQLSPERTHAYLQKLISRKLELCEINLTEIGTINLTIEVTENALEGVYYQNIVGEWGPNYFLGTNFNLNITNMK